MKTRTRTRRFGNMPTLVELDTVKIHVYVNDASHGPHVHVCYPNRERNSAVLISIAPKSFGTIIERRREPVSDRDLREAMSWLRLNHAYALQEWYRYNPLLVRKPGKHGRRT
jgi:hypothetical protein